jgi:beta-glucosidase
MGKQEEQIEALIGELTLDEKIAMIHGAGFFRTSGIERLGIPPLAMSDGPMGVRNEFPDDKWIPVGNSDDYVTYLPSNSAVAASWNPERAYEFGSVLGEEARGRGKDVILAPGINMKRDPLCGRNFEYMSEDPYLAAELCAPLIKGVQENDVAACVKHFTVNNQETDRLEVDTIVGERALQEIYLPAFYAAVKRGEVYSLMNAYNKCNGSYCGENKELLDHILREEWGYDGTVISDWGSIHSTLGTLDSSMDIEMSVTTNFDQYYLAQPLKEAVEKGEADPKKIDEKVRRILRMMFRLKMMGDQAEERKPGAYDTPDHQEKAAKIAQESIVLLQNREQILPITKERLQPVSNTYVKGDNLPKTLRKRKIVLIGQNANKIHSAGGGSAEIKALYEITPLLALKSRLGGNVEIQYAPGYYVPEKTKEEETNWQAISLERQMTETVGEETEEMRSVRIKIEEKRCKLREEALALASQADEVIFVGGINHDYDTEGKDRGNMKLPYDQDTLIEALLEQKPDTVIVLIGGSPVEMPWREKAKAIVWSYYAGMMTGYAIADVLLGKVNPSGKLPETFPVKYEDTVTAHNGQFGRTGRVEYQEGIFIGYRYYEKENITPAFAFGHGLSYTTFEVKDIQTRLVQPVLPQKLFYKVDDPIWDETCADITVQIQNTGKAAGAQVLQCYISDCECRVERPKKELKGFCKIYLEPGESRQVAFSLPLRAFSFYDETEKSFAWEPGAFQISVGTSSDKNKERAEICLKF